MYAVIAHGGKQYRVAPGDTVRLENVAGTEGDPGTSIELGNVRLFDGGSEGGFRFGSAVAAVKVVATIVKHDRGPKKMIFKKNRCKQYRRTQGHRQGFTEVRIERIS